MSTISIHQPNYLPWMGFFHKILKSDIFVILDDVQYTKNSYQNRVRIKGPNGVVWLTEPVKSASLSTLTCDIVFDNEIWKSRHIKTIQAFYGKSHFFKYYESDVLSIFNNNFSNLVDFNLFAIREILRMLRVEVQMVKSSELNVLTKGTDRLVEIVQLLGGKKYICGAGADNYQEDDKFFKNSIGVEKIRYVQPVYGQLWGGFVPHMSILDLLFNSGPQSIDILVNSDLSRL